MTGQPRHCDTGMGSFYGMFLYEQIIPKDHFMRALKNLFDWDELGQGLISPYDGKGEQGRPACSRQAALQSDTDIQDALTILSDGPIGARHGAMGE